MSSPEALATHPDYTFSLADTLPKFSMKPEKMGGVTHQQWLNGYLERRSAYVEESMARGVKPTVGEFHAKIAKDMIQKPTYSSFLGKMSAALERVVEPDHKRKAAKGLSDTSPYLLTEDGAMKVIEEMRDSQRRTPYKVEKREERVISRAETVGRFILENGFKILDPSSGTVIDPRTLAEFEQEGLEPSLQIQKHLP